MIAAVLGWLAPLVVPEGVGAELLFAAGLLALVLAFAALLRTPTTASAHVTAVTGFAELRVRLRASDPDAAGHHRARAPGSTRWPAGDPRRPRAARRPPALGRTAAPRARLRRASTRRPTESARS